LITTAVLLTGISLMVVPRVLQVTAPSWWKTTTILVAFCGAVGDLLAVWSVNRRPDGRLAW
jgi:hypothetical protein